MPAHRVCCRSARHLPLVPQLMVVPVLLAIATAASLFAHSDVNAALLWSQCHARAALPVLSRVPLLGTPACFLVSFVGAALDSLRGRAVLACVVAFLGALLTVSAVESARPVNARNRIVARPALPWLLFVLTGGSALVWQLVIVPAFLRVAGTWAPRDDDDDVNDDDDDDDDYPRPNAHVHHHHGRDVPLSDVVAVPLAVALGFYLPSALMLATASPASIGIWLFFPLYVSCIRACLARLLAATRWFRSRPPTCHLESRVETAAAVYALPVLASLLAHAFYLASLTWPDDRKELTRSAVKFLEIDSQYIALTLLYWVFVEVGWRVPLAIIASSVFLGPGAATALGWLYREKRIDSDLAAGEADEPRYPGSVDADDEERRGPTLADEQTPLVQ